MNEIDMALSFLKDRSKIISKKSITGYIIVRLQKPKRKRVLKAARVK